MLRTGARLWDLPGNIGGSPSTCWKRPPQRRTHGTWLRMWVAFLSELDVRVRLGCSESFLDGSFAPAKEGATPSAGSSGVREQSGWYVRQARRSFGETLAQFVAGKVRVDGATPRTIAELARGLGRPRKRQQRVIAVLMTVIHCETAWASDTPSCSAPTPSTGDFLAATKVARCAAIKILGKSRGPSPGWTVSDASLSSPIDNSTYRKRVISVACALIPLRFLSNLF